jgi:hypothetical protein
MEHGPRCWGWIEVVLEDRNGEDICRCNRCGQMFHTDEANRDGADIQVLREFNSEDEVITAGREYDNQR